MTSMKDMRSWDSEEFEKSYDEMSEKELIKVIAERQDTLSDLLKQIAVGLDIIVLSGLIGDYMEGNLTEEGVNALESLADVMMDGENTEDETGSPDEETKFPFRGHGDKYNFS